MRQWSLHTSADFDKTARKIDRAVLRRVFTYLDEVCTLLDPRSRGKALTANMTGFWRYRVGDYRVIVEIQDAQLVIVAVAMGHRSVVYGD
ncbi:type II toxin-antitoxin system RelE/ParE family toxin [Arthrobacter sp. NA-172]|uniref:type II toxin-antitoxin system RelE family toxin n=1 Tax=Arthrobacter sp. NA-172 TaxID=3367524 RepID=UPI0037547CDF